MDETSLLDRLLRLPPRQLEMSPARVFWGVTAPVAIAVAIALFYYPLALRLLGFDATQFEHYVQNVRSGRLLHFWLPAVLTPLSNMPTALDMFRGRQLSLVRRTILFALIWALSIVPTTLYWLGEFRKAARQPADEVSPMVETG